MSLETIFKNIGANIKTNLENRGITVANNSGFKTILLKIFNLIDTKQDVISDLATIRNGANKGATALQPNDDISKLTNDVGYLTTHQSLTHYYTKDETYSSEEIDGFLDPLDMGMNALYQDTQDIISDLATIRDGANKGETSLQPIGTSSQFLKADGSIDDNKYARVITNNEDPNITIQSPITEGLEGNLGDICKDTTNGKLYVLYKIEVI